MPTQRSLSRRLPMLLALVQGLVVLGIGWAAYHQVRTAILGSTVIRLEAASRDVAGMIQASLRQMRHELDTVATNPSIREFGGTRAPAARRNALLRLHDVLIRSPQYRFVSIWDKTGQPLLSTASDAETRAIALPGDGTPWHAGDAATPLAWFDGAVIYGVVAPIVERRDTVGFLVAGRRFDNRGSGDLIARLVGPGTRFRLGSSRGGVWSDLARPVEPPPSNRATGRPYADETGAQRIASSAAIPGAPWTVWIDASTSTPLMTAHTFLRDIAAVSALFVLLGGLAVWGVVRKLTGPLSDLKQAAEEVAFGDYTKRVKPAAENEIGALARSFNVMAERVELAVGALKTRAMDLEQRNRALRESELRYRQLVDQSPDAIVVHRNGRVVFASAMAARLVGLPEPADMVGRDLSEFVHPSDRAQAERRIADALSGGASTLAELRLLKVDGTTVLAEVSGVPVVFDAEPAVQTLARDVTERKLFEERMRQAQRVEAVGRLAGGIAHDFNNLLTVIHTYTELSLAVTPADDARRDDLEEIQRASLSAARLTRQMLAFSRRQVVARRSVNVNDSIDEVVRMLRRVIGDNVGIQANLASALEPIWADPGQVEQVLVNLVVNARDAMPHGGTIVIETAAARVSGESPAGDGPPIPAGDYVVLSVTDSGSGMTDEVRARLFEPFFTTKPQGEGTGLGLAVVYAITEQSGGYIRVTTALGKGSSFRLFFPAHRGAAPLAEPRSEEDALPSRRPARVLLVEDERAVRSALRRGLERAGYSVVEADCGRAAMDAFVGRSGEFDVVVTDMMMPGMTGEALVRALREHDPDVRAIVMSGYSAELGGRDWHLPPNTSFVAKPITPVDLGRRIDELMAISA
ncbi:MAG TPA: ATP-binding protein [Gemmatimonadaceae bacterium]